MNITKGEWKAKKDNTIWGDDDRTIVADCFDRPANAHLIASAPLMYEAIKQTIEDVNDRGLTQESINKLHKALAKAEEK